MHSTHPEMNYGVNILGDRELAFELAHKYGAKFIQIDSVCGHLKPKDEQTYVSQLQENREKYAVAVLGGVRFKYQPVRSGKSNTRRFDWPGTVLAVLRTVSLMNLRIPEKMRK